MYALDVYIASLGPTLLVIGLVAFIALSRPDRPVIRACAIAFSVVLMWRYMGWRLSDTVPALDDSVPDAIAGWIFASIEAMTLVSATLAMFILSRTRNRTA
jgi:cellulose synthase (UDP-forming)